MIPDWMKAPPSQLEDKIALLKQQSQLLKSKGPKGKFLRSLLRDVQEQIQSAAQVATSQDPLQFFKPSLEQAIILNAWLYGIDFLCLYFANRVGKTTVDFVNILLWIFPNKPSWKQHGIFRSYIVGEPGYDEENQHNENASSRVQVFPRPPLENLAKIRRAIRLLNLPPDELPDPQLSHTNPRNQKVLQLLQKKFPHLYRPAFPYAPLNKDSEIWIGGPDHQKHKTIFMPLFKKYYPISAEERYVPTDAQITLKIQGPKNTTKCEIRFLSFESTETKWASGAVDGIVLTEGVTPAIWKEAKLRFKSPGFGGHDFTPYDPANSSPSVALAQRIKKGTEGMPLAHHVFEGFGVFTAPVHILPSEKREGMIKAFKGDAQAEARLYGRFYTSSNLLLANLNKEYHLLPWTFEELLRRYPTANLYRGLDPGLDHPCACVWAALLPTNQWVIYRIMAERGMDIPTRCQEIISRSNNVAARQSHGPNSQFHVTLETQPFPNSEAYFATIADYHVFKEDETTGQPFSLNYTINGLNIQESVHTGPEQRVELFDSALKRSEYLPNLQSLQKHQQYPAGLEPDLDTSFYKSPLPSPSLSPSGCLSGGGARVYFLRDGPGVLETLLKWEELYWERYKAGPNKGLPKGTVPEENDDELDGASYLICSPYRWTNKRAPRILIGNVEPENYLLEASRNIQEKQQQQTAAQQLHRPFGANVRPNQQVIFFGGKPNPAYEDDDR